MTRFTRTSTSLLLALGMGASAATGAVDTSCVRCHGDPDLFEGDDLAVVHDVETSVHGAAGLSCHDCHGGNPDVAVAEDADAAMDPGFAPNPYVGPPARADVPSFCGRCHSDPAYMKRFRPDFRVDQEAEYRTSHHGVALAAGDTRVATCVSCHGTHDILPVKDSASPVYPTRVAETCRGCHGDAETMAGYRRDDGTPLPVDQYERWTSSVHGAAMLVRGDVSAPTCNDCHGNHGAAPPGLESVALVCGQCHGREADLFRESPKRAGFEAHNEYLADAEDGCRDCHEAPEPAVTMSLRHFSECATCHDNHAVLRPTVAMLGALPATPCAFCHEGDDPPAGAASEPERIRAHYRDELGRLMAEAEASGEGLEGELLFDWLVDRALELPAHTTASADRDTGSHLRPEFAKLFSKFRIGKTHHVIGDAESGRTSLVRVVQCTDCHAAPDVASVDPVGHETAASFLARMHDLTSQIARTERTLLAARRGGVEVGEGSLELDRAVGVQVELEALVHTFDADTSAAFVHKQAEGLEHTESALVIAQAGLRELSNRRRGLTIALGVIVLLLIGLGLKIRWAET